MGQHRQWLGLYGLPCVNSKKACASAHAFLLLRQNKNGIAEATPEEIDEYNILNASMLAMRRAIEKMGVEADCALIDGNHARGFHIDAFPIVKGDAKSASIAAASILAKVTRDRMCIEQDALYPEYNIKKHKGYPTKEHMDAVRKYGPSPIHRKTFLKFLDEEG